MNLNPAKIVRAFTNNAKAATQYIKDARYAFSSEGNERDRFRIKAEVITFGTIGVGTILLIGGEAGTLLFAPIIEAVMPVVGGGEAAFGVIAGTKAAKLAGKLANHWYDYKHPEEPQSIMPNQKITIIPPPKPAPTAIVGEVMPPGRPVTLYGPDGRPLTPSNE